MVKQHIRQLGDSYVDSILSCGYMNKYKGHHRDNIIFEYFGGLYVLEGSGIYHQNKRAIPFKKGDFVMRMPNTPHATTVTSEKYREVFVCFGKNLYSSFIDYGLLNINRPILHPRIQPSLIESFRSLYNLLKDTNEAHVLLKNALSLITDIVYYDSLQEKSPLETIYAKIENSIEDNLSLNKLCDEHHISYETFRKKFKKNYSITPYQFVISSRIRKACEYLSDSPNLKLDAIANILGYSHTSIFLKQFKDVIGLTPSEYKRKLYQNL